MALRRLVHTPPSVIHDDWRGRPLDPLCEAILSRRRSDHYLPRPMKPILIGCAVVLALGVIAAVIVVVRLSRGPIVFTTTKRPDVTVVVKSIEPGGFVLEATLSADSEGFVIRDIAVPRACAESLGLGTPSNFHTEGFPLEDQEKSDPEAIEFARKYDSENTRWAGPVPILFGQPLTIDLPTSKPHAGLCTLSVGYERRGRFGGMSAMATVDVGMRP